MKGYINIFDNDGMYSSGSGIYNTKESAEETGKMVKGYLDTVVVEFNEENNAK